jgi:hypothetical protein
MMVQNVEETNLAWALVDAARPHLAESERSRVFVAVGAGDTFAAIRILLKLLSAKRIPLRADLVRRCTTWLGTYSRHEEEQHLRRLIECLLSNESMPDSPTVRVKPAATAPKHNENRRLTLLCRNKVSVFGYRTSRVWRAG